MASLRFALIFFAALVPTSLAADETLSIKGVTLGDTIDRVNDVGICTVNRGGSCVGFTTYGPDPKAGFMVHYTGGKIDSITITFDKAYRQEVKAGLTKRYGE